VTCETCGATLAIGDFPFCHGDPANHQPYSGGIVPDDIPGGLLITNGLCHADGTPRRFDTRSAIAAEARRRGYTNMVRHQGTESGDRSRQTQRFV